MYILCLHNLKRCVEKVGPWASYASYQIRKIAGCSCAENAQNAFPANAGWRSRHASRHVRDARTVMHAGIANLRIHFEVGGGEKVPGIPGACAKHNFTYMAMHQ